MLRGAGCRHRSRAPRQERRQCAGVAELVDAVDFKIHIFTDIRASPTNVVLPTMSVPTANTHKRPLCEHTHRGRL